MSIKDFFERLSPEQIEEGNRRQLERNKQVFEEFRSAYQIGKCSLCGLDLLEFSSSRPCFHWFLRPHGIKKKHFNRYLTTPIGFFRFDSYIRWVANLENPLRNINDLRSEMNPEKVVEYTVKYKNIEWSVSLGKTDRQGHVDSKNASFPHFHIQMKVDGKVFLKFNDFHVPLSKEDLFMLEALEVAPERIAWKNSFGMGMSAIEDEDTLREIDSIMRRTDNLEEATFDTTTMFEFPEGKDISGEKLAEIFEESSNTGIPVRHLLQKYFPDGKSLTEIRPSENVPIISKRTPRK